MAWLKPGAAYWARVGREMTLCFPHASPEVIWIVGTLEGHGTHFGFLGTIEEPGIPFSQVDENRPALDLFDCPGVKAWRQVEPEKPNMERLVDIIPRWYNYHPSAVGVGVDVEW
jgi:hypothetical protein